MSGALRSVGDRRGSEATIWSRHRELMLRRRGQAIYWSSIGLDCLRGRASRSIHVLGFPGSGTNWLCHLVSGATGTPIFEPWNRSWPRFAPAVFHMHRFIPLASIIHRRK